MIDLEKILLDTRNAIVKQYGKLFAMENVRLNFTRDAVKAVAEKAMELKTGARALRSIMEKLMLDVMYELPGLSNVDEVSINRAVVDGKRKPKYRTVSKRSRRSAA